MTSITLKVPDSIAKEITDHEDRLPEILASGLEAFRGRRENVNGNATEIYAFFARNPTPEQILAIRPSRAFGQRIARLLEKSKGTGLTPEEQSEWEDYELAEHLVRIAKARAFAKLHAA